VTPVLAYVGLALRGAPHETEGFPERAEGLGPEPPDAVVTDASGTSDEAVKAMVGFDNAVQEAAVGAEVEALLPHTEAEYEAWARKQYPHVMWLYDVLTKPEYGLNWQPGPIERFEASNNPGAPFTDASLGWRKLLIDSGELFRFDWPKAVNDPCCRPTLTGLEAATAVAGYAVEFCADGRFALPAGLRDELESANPAAGDYLGLVSTPEGGCVSPIVPAGAPDGYAALVAADIPLARRTLVYLAVSSSIIGADEWEGLADQAKTTLADLYTQHKGSLCVAEDGLTAKIDGVLGARDRLLTVRARND